MSKSSTTKQTNEPPSWAKPLLTQGAQDALRLYNNGIGYNAYKGPTMAALSDPTLSGMNSMLAATGYKGPPVTNQSIQSNSAIQQAQNIISQLQASMAQKQAQAAQPAQNSPSTMTQMQAVYGAGGGDSPAIIGYKPVTYQQRGGNLNPNLYYPVGS